MGTLYREATSSQNGVASRFIEVALFIEKLFILLKGTHSEIAKGSTMKFTNNKFTLIAAMMLLSSVTSMNASAGSDKYDAIYDKCVNEAGTMNNSVVQACSSAVSDQVKKDMNKLYDIIHKNISKQSVDDANKFEQSQRTWLKYRASHCELMGSYVGSPMYSFCPMQLNKLRVAELAELAGE